MHYNSFKYICGRHAVLYSNVEHLLRSASVASVQELRLNNGCLIIESYDVKIIVGIRLPRRVYIVLGQW